MKPNNLTTGMAATARIDDKANELEIWTGDGAAKIFQRTEWQGAKGKVLTIELAQNETEGAQIFLRAANRAVWFTVTVSDLIGNDFTIQKDRIKVYVEKYVTLSGKTASDEDFPEGARIPDAILPLEKAVEYRENCVCAGENQGLYIEVETEETTRAGNYEGVITVGTEQASYNVPMRVRVFDFALPSTSKCLNYWNLMGSSFGGFEMDASEEMFRAYLDTYRAYKLNSKLPHFGKGGVKRYIEILREYFHKPGFALYNFYYESTQGVYRGKESEFNADKLKEYLCAAVNASVEDGKDYLSKAILSFGDKLDEPATPHCFARVKRVMDIFAQVIEDALAESDARFRNCEQSQFYYGAVRDSLQNLASPIAENYHDTKRILESAYGVLNVTHCPIIWDFETQTSRDFFLSDPKGCWFYTCTCPVNPYPTTHVDDYTVTCRAISWMQKAYGIKGYLNWDGALHRIDHGFDSPYDTALRGFCPGDGYVFYPGAQYGIYGPVASLRAVALRDGAEDYDYLAILEARYAARGVSADGALSLLYDTLFTAVSPVTQSEILYGARARVAELIEETQRETGILFGGFAVGDGKIDLKVAPAFDGAVISYCGQILKRGGDGWVTLSVSDKPEELVLTLSTRQITRAIPVKLPKKRILRNAFAESFGIRVNCASERLISEEYVTGAYGDHSLQLLLKSGDVDSENPCFAIPANAFPVSLDRIARIGFMLASDCAQRLTMRVACSDGPSMRELGEIAVYQGFNRIELDEKTMKAGSVNGKEPIKEILFSFDKQADRTLKLFLDGISYTLRGQTGG